MVSDGAAQERALATAISSLLTGLDPHDLSITPLLNWGGFVNRSFRVSDGVRAYFFKVVGDAARRGRLQTLERLSHRLHERCFAPRMIGRVVVDPTCDGALFDWIEGAAPDALTPRLLDRLIPGLVDLHGDGETASVLRAAGDAHPDCAATYLATYHDRLTEDLAFIAQAPPPFLPPERLEWMFEEVNVLERLVRQAAAFAFPADRPMHGDLWLDNLLVSTSGALHVLDWDELQLGDPAIDWAMLLGPSRRDIRPATAREPVRLPDLDVAGRERFELYARASLLDWVIDPLSDWLDAETQPPGATAVRPEKQAVHERAAAVYQQLYLQ